MGKGITGFISIKRKSGRKCSGMPKSRKKAEKICIIKNLPLHLQPVLFETHLGA
jgi:hypothetical protein